MQAFLAGAKAPVTQKDQIESMLVQGISPAIIANQVGCEPSYISQLTADDEFMERVNARKAAILTRGLDLDSMYDDIEAKAGAKLQSYIGMISDPMKLARILQVANGAKRRSSAPIDTGNQNAVLVNIVLPQAILPHITVDNQGEVVNVNGTSLVTMPSATFKSLAERMQDEEAIKLLPCSSPPESDEAAG